MMRTTTLRRGLVAGGLLPVVTAALLVRPAPAESQESAFGLYALTVAGAASTTEGEAGAGGGLAVIDSGAPSVTGRLDSSPSGAIKAAPVEPGTLFRTVVGLANNEAGGETVPVPTATSSYPGSASEDEVEGTGEQAFGPYTTTGYHARTTATELAITGVAQANEQTYTDESAATTASATSLREGLLALAAAYPSVGFRVSDDDTAYRSEGGRVTATATADPATGVLEATVRSVSGRTTFLGQITYGSVVGTATVTLVDGARAAEAETTVGAVEIGGVPVELGSAGVSVAGTELLPGQTFADLNAQLNAVLTQAGVTMQPLEPTREVGDGFAQAGSGGVKVTVATAPNPQVPGNDLTVVLGQASASLSDEPPFPAFDGGSFDGGTTDTSTGSGTIGTPSGSATSGGFGVGTSVPPSAGSVGEPVGGGPAAPAVAPPASGAGEQPVLVAGRRMTKRAALAAFGGWQLLSLSICTLAAFALRGRDTEVEW